MSPDPTPAARTGEDDYDRLDAFLIEIDALKSQLAQVTGEREAMREALADVCRAFWDDEHIGGFGEPLDAALRAADALSRSRAALSSPGSPPDPQPKET